MVINHYDHTDQIVTRSDMGFPTNPIVTQTIPDDDEYHVRYCDPYESDHVGIIRSRLNLM